VDKFISIGGWILWALFLVTGLAWLNSGDFNAVVRSNTRKQGIVYIMFCVATAALGLSPFWVLAALPVVFFLPLFLPDPYPAHDRPAETKQHSDRK
jgi:hypothetical protein